MAPPVTQTFDTSIGEYGQDYALKAGTPIYTPVAGVVSTEDNGKQAWGKRAIITAASGLSFAVGHLTQFAVTAGQKVAAGTLVGYSGGAPSDPSSGVSTGAHVETQFFTVGNKGPQYVDPKNVFSQFASWEPAIFTGILPQVSSDAQGLNPLAGIPEAISSATSRFVALLTRAGFFVLGFALFMTGLWLIVRGDVEKAASDALDNVHKAQSAIAPAVDAVAPEAAAVA